MEQINEIAKALSLAQSVMKAAPKNKVNPYFKSKYADLDCIWDAIRKPLTDNGLSVAQFATSDEDVVTVVTLLMHVSGQSLKSDLSMKAKDATPQSIGSAITYGRRYGLSAMVGVSVEEDDDANAAQGKSTEYIDSKQISQILDLCASLEVNMPQFVKYLGVESLEKLPASEYQKAIVALEKKAQAKK